VHRDAAGSIRGLLVLEEKGGAWRVVEEHVLVGDGPCPG
jgi:hypothetical protein